MPGSNGLEAACLLRQEVPSAKILILSQHDPVSVTASGDPGRRAGVRG
jgi:DNA-binding NarL/FixJ family response regulator